MNSGFVKKEKYSIEDLLEIMSLLRSENGCPWDKEQTHESIRKNFIEETYEAVEAIDRNDPEMLREELGDVLLQVVFHTQMEKEKGNFDFDDVSDMVCKKLIERHPHVFADVSVSGTDGCGTKVKLAQLSKILSFVVLGICAFIFAFTIIRNGNFERLWSGYSATTMRHINSFIDTFGTNGGGKAWWDKLAVTEN